MQEMQRAFSKDKRKQALMQLNLFHSAKNQNECYWD
jgi:hypothetical protein